MNLIELSVEIQNWRDKINQLTQDLLVANAARANAFEDGYQEGLKQAETELLQVPELLNQLYQMDWPKTLSIPNEMKLGLISFLSR